MMQWWLTNSRTFYHRSPYRHIAETRRQDRDAGSRLVERRETMKFAILPQFFFHPKKIWLLIDESTARIDVI